MVPSAGGAVLEGRDIIPPPEGSVLFERTEAGAFSGAFFGSLTAAAFFPVTAGFEGLTFSWVTDSAGAALPITTWLRHDVNTARHSTTAVNGRSFLWKALR